MAPRHGEPVFVISVAARLLEMHPQTLRKYEREGLIEPSRTTGNLRLYSDRDIKRLRQVKYLVDERRLNLAGVQLALDLTHRLRETRRRVAEAERAVGSGTEVPGPLGREFDALLAMLGYVEEPGPIL